MTANVFSFRLNMTIKNKTLGWVSFGLITGAVFLIILTSWLNVKNNTVSNITITLGLISVLFNIIVSSGLYLGKSHLAIQIIVYALIIFAVFRMFSRNTEQRRKENYWIREKLGFIKRKKDFHAQKKADKVHVYKKCPACGAVLRLPRRIGVHKTVCPKCGKEFTVKVKK